MGVLIRIWFLEIAFWFLSDFYLIFRLYSRNYPEFSLIRIWSEVLDSDFYLIFIWSLGLIFIWFLSDLYLIFRSYFEVWFLSDFYLISLIKTPLEKYTSRKLMIIICFLFFSDVTQFLYFQRNSEDTKCFHMQWWFPSHSTVFLTLKSFIYTPTAFLDSGCLGKRYHFLVGQVPKRRTQRCLCSPFWVFVFDSHSGDDQQRNFPMFFELALC